MFTCGLPKAEVHSQQIGLVRKELEEGEKGKMGDSGEDRNEQLEKTRRWREGKRKERINEGTTGRRQ